MTHIAIHSRTGNVTLAVFGSMISVAAVIVFALFVLQTWDGASLVERAIQLLLPLSALAGVYMVRVGVENLSLRPRPLSRR